MNKYRLAVCDDDPVLLSELSGMCASILEQKKMEYEITQFSSAAQLGDVLKIKADAFDILLLDIQMKGKTGMQLAKTLRENGNRVSIIFVTGSEDYLLEGYSVQPVNYLLKPVSEDALKKALETDLQLSRRANYIFLKMGGKSVSLLADKIMYIESFNHSVTVCFPDDTVSYPLSLAAVQGELSSDPRFYRCYKSFIVNMDYVREISRSGVLIGNGVQIPVGRSFLSAFQLAFVKYLNR